LKQNQADIERPERSLRAQIKEIAKEIVRGRVEEAEKRGCIFQITVSGLATAVLEFAIRTEKYQISMVCELQKAQALRSRSSG